MPARGSLCRWIARVVAGLVLSLPACAFATSPVHPPEPLYPTDRCVVRKLAAAADACQDLILAQGERNAKESAARVNDAEEDLAHAWQKAEAGSSAAGLDCVQTTVTSAEMASLLEDGAIGLAASLETAQSKHGDHKPLRGELHAVGDACAGLILAESRHLLERFKDRNTRGLERDRAHALRRLSHALDLDDPAHASLETVRTAVETLAQQAIDAAIVSPNVSTSWTMVTPDPQVPYLGQVLEPICAEGTPWVYFVKRGTVNKLIV